MKHISFPIIGGEILVHAGETQMEITHVEIKKGADYVALYPADITMLRKALISARGDAQRNWSSEISQLAEDLMDLASAYHGASRRGDV